MRIKSATFLLNLTLLLIVVVIESTSSTLPRPQALSSFNPKISTNQIKATCSYTVTIKTSCSSTKYTRDQISLSFGDAYGNQIYAPRLDDPRSRTFESCSTDTFEISGPCVGQICYLYLYRTGSDGWKPETVKVYGRNTKAVTFRYDQFIPYGTWYGFDHCRGARFGHVMVM